MCFIAQSVHKWCAQSINKSTHFLWRPANAERHYPNVIRPAIFYVYCLLPKMFLLLSFRLLFFVWKWFAYRRRSRTKYIDTSCIFLSLANKYKDIIYRWYVILLLLLWHFIILQNHQKYIIKVCSLYTLEQGCTERVLSERKFGHVNGNNDDQYQRLPKPETQAM